MFNFIFQSSFTWKWLCEKIDDFVEKVDDNDKINLWEIWLAKVQWLG